MVGGVLVYGWGKQTKKICCTLNEVKCNNCDEVSEWIVIRVKTWFTLFYIPVLPYKIQQFAYCPNCNCGGEINDAQWRLLCKHRDENKHINLQPVVVEYTYSFIGWFIRGLTKRKWRYLPIYLSIIFVIWNKGYVSLSLTVQNIGLAVITSFISAIILSLIYALISKLAKRHIIGIKFC